MKIDLVISGLIVFILIGAGVVGVLKVLAYLTIVGLV